MADALSIGRTKLLRKAAMDGDVDFLREGVRVFSQALMELEVTQHVGAERHARTEPRTGQRNGDRERRWDTRVGTVDLQVPRVRDGSYFPALLEARRRTERALVAVVQEAYVHGVSMRRVEDLVQALGIAGISKSEVSRLCATLDAEVERFRTRPLVGTYPYVWLDATDLNVRQDGRVVLMALVIAIGVNGEGRREVVGVDVGPSEEEAFWQQFLRALVERGLTGVRLVISDAHAGLKRAVTTILHGASWQRCRVHCVRNARALVPKSAQQLVAATIRTVFRPARCGECAGAMATGSRQLP
jgi:transposase-like protein